MACWVLADALLEKLGGDSMTEVLEHLAATRALWKEMMEKRP
jgi:hypothetical protein